MKIDHMLDDRDNYVPRTHGKRGVAFEWARLMMTWAAMWGSWCVSTARSWWTNPSGALNTRANEFVWGWARAFTKHFVFVVAGVSVFTYAVTSTSYEETPLTLAWLVVSWGFVITLETLNCYRVLLRAVSYLLATTDDAMTMAILCQAQKQVLNKHGIEVTCVSEPSLNEMPDRLKRYTETAEKTVKTQMMQDDVTGLKEVLQDLRNAITGEMKKSPFGGVKTPGFKHEVH